VSSVIERVSPESSTPKPVASEPAFELHDTSGLTPATFPAVPPGFVIRMVIALRRFLVSLADLVIPPEAALFERVTGIAHTQILGAIARHRIADILVDGPLNARELADKTQTNADAMHRIMRAAATTGVFRIRPDGRFENNRLSLALRSGQIGRAREFAEYFGSASNCAAYCALEHTLQTGQDGFEYANKMDLWQWFDAHPHEREVFAQMMMGVTIGETPMVANLYPFNEIKRLCDVGGGRGALLSELLIRFPHLQGVLFDCAGVIDSAKPLLAARGVSDRVETVVGNFFEAVVPGCDAYLLKNVMHDWDDGRCRTILKACRNAMGAGNRILLVEIIVEPNDATNFGSLRDVHVLTVCTGGRERSVAEFQGLLESAGFKFQRVFHSPIISVVEGIAI